MISGQKEDLGRQSLAQKDIRFYTRIFQPYKKCSVKQSLIPSDVKEVNIAWCCCSGKSPL